MNTVTIDGRSLTLNDVYNVAHKNYKVTLSKESESKMKEARDFVDQIVKEKKPVYGINTGFGALSSKYIEEKDLETLQYNLIRSHATGVGNPFSIPIVRAIMLLRANCLASGFSGVSIEHVERLIDFLNYEITPVVPEKGSVGASGDLAPLSHIALCLIGEGEVFYQGKQIGSHLALSQIGKSATKLKAKDGLALINGTAVMTALGSLAFVEASEIVKLADITCALTLDATRGTIKAYDERISKLKPHDGQIKVSKNLLKLLSGSEIGSSHPNCGKVQDPYSLRCVPQVHGSVRQTLKHAYEVLSIELNSVTDNPLIFIEDKEVISGGNFHGEALAMAMDYLTIGLSELANIAERRVEKMMNPSFSDLPAFLIEGSGLNSGLMIAHVTMAALASENKYLSHPASVDSIPTSTDKEDHVSMGVTSGRKLHEVLFNLKKCLAIELLCNTQGIEFLRPLKTSKPLESVMSLIRNHIEPITQDRIFYKDIEKISNLVDNFEIIRAVENEIGTLL